MVAEQKQMLAQTKAKLDDFERQGIMRCRQVVTLEDDVKQVNETRGTFEDDFATWLAQMDINATTLAGWSNLVIQSTQDKFTVIETESVNKFVELERNIQFRCN